MQISETKTSSSASPSIQAKRQPFFNHEGRGGFFSRSEEIPSPFFVPSAIQPNLALGAPDDPFEQEANKISRQIIDNFGAVSSIQTKLSNLGLQSAIIRPMPIGTPISSVVQPRLDTVCKKCTECEEEEKRVQPRRMGIQFSGEGAMVPRDIEARIQSQRGRGQAMDAGTRSAMEGSFGADFGGVNIHTGTAAVQMSRELNAHAFTVGNDIFFNQGRYRPRTREGAGLLAHELTHTVQQGASVQGKRARRQPLSALLSRHAMAHLSVNGENALNRKEIGLPDRMPGEEMLQQKEIFESRETDKIQKKDSGLSLRTCSGGGKATTCQVPLTMTKVVSGPFQGGLTMDSYYPDLKGGGYYDHPGTAGTFDTGSRAGSNVQLVASVPKTCTPNTFTLGQTVKYTNTIKNGVRHPKEGIVQDDIAKSGRDASKAPFRQEWVDGNDLKISMADPPSFQYGAGDNAEWDREFVTKLAGPGGSKEVKWATSIRVVNGAVTKNTVT